MNQWEMVKRQEKAEALTAALVACGATVEDVVNAKPKTWLLCAEAATELLRRRGIDKKVQPPKSQATIDLIVKLLEREVRHAPGGGADSQSIGPAGRGSEVLNAGLQNNVEVRNSLSGEGGFGSPFGNYKTAQQEADEAEAAERKAEDKWEESQEYAGNRCPPRE